MLLPPNRQYFAVMRGAAPLKKMMMEAYEGYWAGTECTTTCLVNSFGMFGYMNEKYQRVAYVWFYRPDDGLSSDGVYIHNVNLVFGVDMTGTGPGSCPFRQLIVMMTNFVIDIITLY